MMFFMPTPTQKNPFTYSQEDLFILHDQDQLYFLSRKLFFKSTYENLLNTPQNLLPYAYRINKFLSTPTKINIFTPNPLFD